MFDYYAVLGINEVTSTLISLLSEIIFALVAYVFKAIAVYTMAKRRNISKPWLAWVPFVNYVLIGKLIGRARVWGLELKNLGLWVAITSFLATGIITLLNAGYYVDCVAKIFDVTITFESEFVNAWLSGSSLIYVIFYYASYVLNLAYIFFEISMIFLIFRLYKPEKATMYSFLSIFFDFLFGVLLFTLRNEEPVDYAGYVRARYDGNFGGYNTDYRRYEPPQTKEKDDPFPEFKQVDDKPFTSNENEDKGDGFFD